MADDTIYDSERALAALRRTQNTNVQGLDQIIAISELTIHSSLDQRWKAAVSRKDRRIKEFNHTTDSGHIKAVMGPPRLQLVVPEAPESVYFIVNFESGSFTYWKMSGATPKSRTQNVAGWSAVFRTNFSLVKLAGVPQAIRDQITMKPGHYSVSQLILGLSAGSLAAPELQWTLCKTPNMPTDPNTQVEVKVAFDGYMARYLKYMEAGPYSVLGYAIKVEVNAAATGLPVPSFPPKRVRCRTQAYMPCNHDFAERFPQHAGLDCIIFEEMTEERQFPGTAYDTEKAGNWVVPGIPSCMVLSRNIFFDQFFFKRFALLNRQCVTLAHEAFFWVYKSEERRRGSKEFYISDDDKPEDLPWNITDTGASFEIKLTRTQGPKTWFERTTQKEWRDNLTTNISNSVMWKPGTGTITATVNIKQKRDTYNLYAGDVIDKGVMKISMNVDVTLVTAKKGALDMNVKYNKPDLSFEHASSMYVFDWWGKRESYEKQVLENLSVIDNLSSIQQDMKTALAGQSKFIFPGAGEFDLKDPTFNTAGDLLLKLTYIAKALAIDDTFHLQTYNVDNDTAHPELNGKWLKVNGEIDGSFIELVASQAEATEFQIDDGCLTVDNKGRPSGLRAMFSRYVVDEDRGVHDCLTMVTSTTFEARNVPTQTMECSTTGSRFVWGKNGMPKWYSFLALDAATSSRVCLFNGDEEEPGEAKVFGLNAVY